MIPTPTNRTFAVADVFRLFCSSFLLLSRVFSSSLSEKTVEWRPSAFPSTPDFWQSAVSMFLRSNNRKKDGKDHRYFSIVENHRIASDKTVQRTVLYLGEINDQQQAAWRKTLSVFDEQQQEYANLSLFPDDREIPADAVDSLQVKLSGLELRRPRLFGSCWLACELWRQLGLHEFWDARLAGSREDVPWEKVLQLLVVNRLLDPGSEFRVHRQWYLTTAMDALLGTDFAVAEKGSLVSLSGSGAGTQAGTVSVAAPEVGRSVSSGIRSAALRPDQHVL